jgi:hypothetical protein
MRTLFTAVLAALIAVFIMSGCAGDVPGEFPDYYTKRGIQVWVDADGTMSRLETEERIDEVLATWAEINPDWVDCAESAARRARIYYYNFQTPPPCPGNSYACANKNGTISIGSGLRDISVQHEISHLIVWDCGRLWGNESHDFFDSVELPY